MKSKFLSVALIVAVSLGMLLVPAVSMVSADTGDCGIEAVSDKDRVVFNETFTVNVTVDNPNALPLNSLQVFLSFDNSVVTVNSISIAGTAFSFVVTGPSHNNATGEISFNSGTPPGTNTTAASCFVMAVNMESLSTPGDTTIAFQAISPTRVTKVYGEGLGDVLNWTDVVNCTVTVGVPQLTATMNPLIPVGPNLTYACGGISMAFNGTWVVPCLIPNTALPYDNITIYYNQTYLLPITTSWAWDECLVVAALDMVPGWGWVSWTGDAGTFDFNYTHALGFLVNGRTMKMDALQKNLTANFAPKSPEIVVIPDSLSFMCNEGVNPSDKYLFMYNSGGGTLAWSATSDAGWLSVNPTSGNLTTSFTVDNVTLAVSVNSTGLNWSAVPYEGNINITGSPNVSIPVELTVNPATSIDVCRTISGTSDSGLPGETDETYPGETFNVTVSFTAPVDDFNAIGMTDIAPDGWTVTVDQNWCDPMPYAWLATGNKAEYLWDSIAKDVNVTAMYQVTVPTTATPGVNSFGDCDMERGWLEYYFDVEGPHVSCIACDTDVTVTQPGDIVGETFDVNHNELPDTDVRLSLDGVGYMRSDISSPLYVNTAYITGTYYQVANITRYFELNANGSTLVHLTPVYHALTTQALLAAGECFNFSGNYGLVPMACDMAYALKSVNLWVMAGSYPAEVGLGFWKANQVIASWQFPS